MTIDDDSSPRDPSEGRPRNITATNVWEAFDRLREDTRVGRHAQNNLFQRAIHEQSESIRTEIRTEVSGMDTRLRKIEEVVIQSSPVTLGGRVNDLERWQSRSDGETSLPARLTALDTRVNDLEGWRDEMRGSFTFLKAASVVVGLVSGLAAILSWVSLSRPPVP